MEHTHHGRPFRPQDGARRERGGGRHAQGLGDQAAFPEERVLVEDGHDRLFPLIGHDRQLDFPFSEIEHGIRGVALRKDDRVLGIVHGVFEPSPTLDKNVAGSNGRDCAGAVFGTAAFAALRLLTLTIRLRAHRTPPGGLRHRVRRLPSL